MKQPRLTFEEDKLVKNMSNDQLRFFMELAKHKDFVVFVDLVNLLIDYEKDYFFGDQEFEPTKLAVDHAFSRGGVAKLTMLLRLIAASEKELLSRKKD